MMSFLVNRGHIIWKLIILGMNLFNITKTDDQGKDCWVQRGSYTYSIKRAHGGVDFRTAAEICVADNASIASVHSESENNFLDHLRKDQVVVPIWIGMQRIKYKRRWIDGTSLDYIAPYEAVASRKACIYLYKSWYEGNCDNKLYFFCKKEVKDVINADEHCSVPTTFLPSPSMSSALSTVDLGSLHQSMSSSKDSSMLIQTFSVYSSKTFSVYSSTFSSIESSYLSTDMIEDVLKSTSETAVQSVMSSAPTYYLLYSSDISQDNALSASSLTSKANLGTSVSEFSKTTMTTEHGSEYSTTLPSHDSPVRSSATSQSCCTSVTTENSESVYPFPTSHAISSVVPTFISTLSIVPSTASEYTDVLRATSPLIIHVPDSTFSKDTVTSTYFTETYVSESSTTKKKPHFDEEAFEKVLEDLRVKKKAKQVAKEAPGGETIGAVAMVILFVIFAGVVLLDLSTIQNHFKLFLRNIKGCTEKKDRQYQLELTSL